MSTNIEETKTEDKVFSGNFKPYEFDVISRDIKLSEMNNLHRKKTGQNLTDEDIEILEEYFSDDNEVGFDVYNFLDNISMRDVEEYQKSEYSDFLSEQYELLWEYYGIKQNYRELWDK